MSKMSVVTETPKPRMDYRHVAPDVLSAMFGLEECIRKSGLERSLLHLVKLRASQINGCAWCIDMHTKDARADGETEWESGGSGSIGRQMVGRRLPRELAPLYQ